MRAPAAALRDWTGGEPRLVLTVCARCGNHWYLPREHCPVCGSDDTDELVAAGAGLCVAVTHVHVTTEAGAAPVWLTLVELDEGPVVMGRASEGLAPGDRARVSFLPDGDGLVPSFTREDDR
ncbi:Zn-ribbon domain-containing OB-fold protein [Nocardioides sp. URHA0032]|uniref:Zn-ribbon domain-containing OB-fold protein n=1 Tax=Nocardioides sp. URHA0032 TaxID=1380388 RepID=UPI00048E5793|nr:zinc ribbon domain-containing protein [Nocardioides sp. URHA0032]